MTTGTSEKSRFILRHVKFRNFVKFDEEQELKFKSNGVYFLVGQNQSGKTSVLEAIRRCLSLKYSSSFSNKPNSKENSIIVSRYENENKEPIVAFCLYTNDNQRTDVCLKGCCLLDKDNKTIKKIGMDLVRHKNGKLISEEIPDLNIGFPVAAEIDLNEFQKWICTHLKGETCTKFDKEKVKSCEELLEQYLDDVVFVFPMRSFGPLQWSKSSKVVNQTANYQEACRRAEIIMWYLQRCEEKDPSRDDERKTEKNMYNFITGGRGGSYVLDHKSEIQIENRGTPYPILKQSEGFVEAKNCSIVLSVKDFGTISLEDPGTGMHPQMIERLCQVMSERVKDRVIIVSTHTTTFLKPWLLDKLFYFKRKRKANADTNSDEADTTDSDETFTIVAGTELSRNEDLKAAIPGKVTSEQFANFCCAETIVFVEGPSDHLFMEALAKIMRNSSEEYFELLSGCQFVSIGGKENKAHFEKCCLILRKRYAFLIDQDDLSNKKTSNNLMFYWDNGNLEDVFWSALEYMFIKNPKHPVNEEMRGILEACFTKKRTPYVTFKEVSTDTHVIEQISPKHRGFKIFIHGNDSFEQREKLIEHLLEIIATVKDENDLTWGMMDIKKIQSFLIKVCKP